VNTATDCATVRCGVFRANTQIARRIFVLSAEKTPGAASGQSYLEAPA
jgi:hypothetical protein